MKIPKKRQCPNCESQKVIPIIYGYIDGSPQVTQQIEDGKIETGGCCVSDESPKWKCQDCNESYGKLDWT